MWIAQERMTPVLRQISQWSPLGASVHALQDAMQGTFPSAQSLLVLAGWAVLFGVLAVRFFRWE
jgi:ABC-2 type transport system permease protein